MNKANRILFDITCIFAILVFPYFILKIIGIEDYMLKEEREAQQWINANGMN